MVLHLRVTQRNLISKIIADFTSNSLQESLDLVRLGSVYYKNCVNSELPSNPSLIESENRERASSMSSNEQKLSSWNRILGDFEAECGDYLKVYMGPRRNNASKLDWKSLITYSNQDFMLLNKPAGVPCHPTADNYIENVLHQVETKIADVIPTTQQEEQDTPEKYFSKKLNYFLPQRLDTDTSGLLFIAKNEETISWINKLLQKKKIKKQYKALIAFHLSDTPSLSLFTNTTNFLGMFPIEENITSYLFKTTYSPKQYIWEVNSEELSKIHSPDRRRSPSSQYQEAIMKINHLSPIVVKPRREWLEYAHSLETETENNQFIHNNIENGNKLKDALNYWMNNLSVSIEGKTIETTTKISSSSSSSSSSSAAATTIITTAEENQGQSGVAPLLSSNDNNHNNIDNDDSQLIGFQEITVELITGRTHQIRGQIQSFQIHPLLQEMTRLSLPISNIHLAGDNMYRGCTSDPSEQYISPYLGLQSYSIELRSPSGYEIDELNHCIPNVWWDELFAN
jgi:23S rRNA-/tRNA-specific pseudouridylate synthase